MATSQTTHPTRNETRNTMSLRTLSNMGCPTEHAPACKKAAKFVNLNNHKPMHQRPQQKKPQVKSNKKPVLTAAVEHNQHQKKLLSATTTLYETMETQEGVPGVQQTLAPTGVDCIATTFSSQLQLSATKEENEEEDVDADDKGNPTFCTEYVKEIYQYLKVIERTYCPNPTYLTTKQPHLSPKMRAILIDWLVLVHQKFSLLQETLYLTASIIDRYLSVEVVSKHHLQLVGVTAMLIASKYEETCIPEVRDFVYITANAYSAKTVRDKEREMLRSLQYSLGCPSPLHFLRRFSKIAKVTPEMHTMAKFLIELCLQDYPMLQYLPSQQAAAALYLSIRMFEESSIQWSPTLERHIGYTKDALFPCLSRMTTLVLTMHSSKQQAVREKYSRKRFLQVALHPSLASDKILKLTQ